MRRIFSLCALLAIFSIAALADIRLPDQNANLPKPKTPKSKKVIETDLHISISRDAKEARLLIPKSQLKQLRAELEQLDEDTDTTAALTGARTQTILGGLFLSLAFVFGGVWVARSRKFEVKANKTLVIGASLFLCGALATIAFANVGPPLVARSITGRIFTKDVHMYKQAWGKIKLETTDETNGVELIVPDVPDENKSEK